MKLLFDELCGIEKMLILFPPILRGKLKIKNKKYA